jgi:hypothetical protein
VLPHHAALDDLVLLMTVTSCSCQFDQGQRCEVKFEVDGMSTSEGQLYLQISPQTAETTKIGDVYSMHIRKL